MESFPDNSHTYAHNKTVNTNFLFSSLIFSEGTTKADEFTLLRNSNQIRLNSHGSSVLSGNSVITYDNRSRSLATLATEESCGSIYKDYFHVLEDGVKGSQDTLCFFKVERTPNGSISGLEYQKEQEKRSVFGSNASMSAPLLTPPAATSSSDKKDVCPVDDGARGQLKETCEISSNPENPYYFKLDSKKPKHTNKNAVKNHDKDNSDNKGKAATIGIMNQESVEENPYYFKVDPKDESCTIYVNKHFKAQHEGSSAASPANGSSIVLLKEQLTCPISDDQADHSDDYQSLLSKKKTNNVQSSSERLKAETNSDYQYLLKPTNGQCTDDDYLSLRKMKTKLDETPEISDNLNEDDEYLKLKKQEDTNYLTKSSNTSDTCSDYFSLLRTIATGKCESDKDDDPYFRLQKQQEGAPSKETNKDGDYQLLKKKVQKEEDIPVEVKDSDGDYQLLRKKSQKQSRLADDGDSNEGDYQILKKDDVSKEPVVNPDAES